MCCDRGWFLWLTALAGELPCHANERMRRWAGLTTDRQVVRSRTRTRGNKRQDGLRRDVSRPRCHECVRYMTQRCRDSPLTNNKLPSQCDKGGNTKSTHMHGQRQDHTPPSRANAAVLASPCSIASPCIREIPRCAVHNKQHGVSQPLLVR